MIFFTKLLEWINKNPWVVVGSFITNMGVLIKWSYSIYITRRLGKAKLAGKRFKELYIPLYNQLYEVKIESFVFYKGRRTSLLKKFFLELMKFLQLNGSKKLLKRSWNDFRNRVSSGPSYEFPWETPDFSTINEILMAKKHIVPKVLEEKWIDVQVLRRESYIYSEKEIDKAIAEFVILVRELTIKTQLYLEKKYPSILAD